MITDPKENLELIIFTDKVREAVYTEIDEIKTTLTTMSVIRAVNNSFVAVLHSGKRYLISVSEIEANELDGEINIDIEKILQQLLNIK